MNEAYIFTTCIVSYAAMVVVAYGLLACISEDKYSVDLLAALAILWPITLLYMIGFRLGTSLRHWGIIAFLLICAPQFSHAGHPCHVRQQVVAHHAYPAQFLVLVGGSIRDEAAIERGVSAALLRLQENPEYAEFLRFREEKKKLEGSAPDWKSTATGQPVAPSAPDGSPSLLMTAKCGSCHGANKQSGGVRFDGSEAVTNDHLGAFTRMATRGLGVPPEMKPLMEKLTPAEKSQIVDELSGLVEVPATASDGEADGVLK